MDQLTKKLSDDLSTLRYQTETLRERLRLNSEKIIELSNILRNIKDQKGSVGLISLIFVFLALSALAFVSFQVFESSELMIISYFDRQQAFYRAESGIEIAKKIIVDSRPSTYSETGSNFDLEFSLDLSDSLYTILSNGKSGFGHQEIRVIVTYPDSLNGIQQIEWRQM